MNGYLVRNAFRVVVALALGLGGAVSEVRASHLTLPTTTVTVINTHDSGAGSFRQSLLDVDSGSGETMVFAIPASDSGCDATGVCTIHLLSGLSPLDRPASTIDGYTQAGAAPNTDPTPMRSNAIIKVVIDGSGVNNQAPGLQVNCNDCTIRGLAIDGFPGAVYGGILVQGNDNVITGNFLGIDAGGTLARGNGASGIRLEGLWTGNRVGGPAPADRNVIGANATNGISIYGASSTTVQGNIIGTKKDGTGSLANGWAGIEVQGGTGNVIGGPGAGEGNLVANAPNPTISGIDLFMGGNNVLSGNEVRFNAGEGISLSGSNGNTLEANVVIGNGLYAFHTAGGISLDYMTSPYVLSSNNVLRNNDIGTDPAGDRLGNYASGIFVRSPSNQIISNTIANNFGEGILSTAGYTQTFMSQNRIASNGALGIDLSALSYQGDGVTPNDTGDTDTGTNNQQNYPVLSAISGTGNSTVITGTLAEDPNSAYRAEFFASPACSDSLRQGETFLGAQTLQTGGDGVVSFTVTLPHAAPWGEFVTATATDPFSNTSEFSACQRLPAPWSVFLPLVRR